MVKLCDGGRDVTWYRVHFLQLVLFYVLFILPFEKPHLFYFNIGYRCTV